MMKVVVYKVGNAFIHFNLDFLEVGAFKASCILVLFEEEYESIAVFPEANNVPSQRD